MTRLDLGQSRRPLDIKMMLVHPADGGLVAYEPDGSLRCYVGTEGESHPITEAEAQAVYPCRVCGWANVCGDPPGEDCHS